MSTLRRHWPLLAVIGIQGLLLALVPWRQVRARMSETEVTLRTVPVDPYDVLSGYYVTLRYEAEIALEGPREEAGTDAWLLVEKGDPAWRAVSCTSTRPEPRASGRSVLRAEVSEEDGTCVIPSSHRFYIPEARRAHVDAAMRIAGEGALVDLEGERRRRRRAPAAARRRARHRGLGGRKGETRLPGSGPRSSAALVLLMTRHRAAGDVTRCGRGVLARGSGPSPRQTLALGRTFRPTPCPSPLPSAPPGAPRCRRPRGARARARRHARRRPSSRGRGRGRCPAPSS